MADSNFSILAGIELDTASIKKQLKEQKINLKVETSGLNEANTGIQKVTDSADAMGLTFQQANLIMQKSLDVINSMVDQVYELNGAITEFKKVSDLSGKSLDNYVAKLTDMGSQVARTGKPKCLALDVQMVNVHQDSLEIQYSLKPI